MDVSRIQQVIDAALHCQVSVSFHLNEGSMLCSYSVHSSAPAEEFCGKDHSFEIATDAVLEHLRSLTTVGA